MFIAQGEDGSRIEYRDTKRYLWLLSLATPFIPLLGVALFFASGGYALALLFPLFFQFVFLPLLDALIGEDPTNPPPEVVDQMAADNYYRVLLHIAVFCFWAAYVLALVFVARHDLPWWAYGALALSVGYGNGTALTVGHELGHKQSRLDRFMAMLACALPGYGHFCIEHNRGHHTHVATPEDCASARYNESLYAFSLREMPGALRRGWKHERERLARKGLRFWSFDNEILRGYGISLAATFLALFFFGLSVLPFILIASYIGWFALTEANYVEHYGLKRQRLPNGRYEPCEPRHSWNTNHIVSNLLLFHLQRHSDHHANPLRPYQALRNFDDLPRLPSGYPGSFLLASIPPLWFRVMNPRVLAWAKGDTTLVNTGRGPGSQ